MVDKKFIDTEPDDVFTSVFGNIDSSPLMQPTPEDAPDISPDAAPDATSDDTPDATPDAAPDVAPDTASQSAESTQEEKSDSKAEAAAAPAKEAEPVEQEASSPHPAYSLDEEVASDEGHYALDQETVPDTVPGTESGEDGELVCATSPDMDVRPEGPVLRITPAGDLTVDKAMCLRQALLDNLSHGHELFFLDLEHAQRVEAECLGVVLSFAEVLQKEAPDGEIHIANGPEELLRLLRASQKHRPPTVTIA